MIKLTNDEVFTGLITWGSFYDAIIKNNLCYNLAEFRLNGIKSLLEKTFLKKFIKQVKEDNDGEKVTYNDDVNALAVMLFDYYEGQ